jgi:NitT/TauT family transport system substrate-binding protein
MINFKNSIVLFFIVILLNGCSSLEPKEKPLKIAVSNWVGYLPLLYAYEKGKLRDLNIEIVPTSSLTASLDLMGRGVVDGFCATQREYKLLKQNNVDIAPILLLDKSYGGDVILSNMTKKNLYSLKNGDIPAYMEVDSANYTLFEYFKKSRNWGNIHFTPKNNTQNFIATMAITQPSIVVTYEPYSTLLLKKGFHLIESTKNENLLIADLLFMKRDRLQNHTQQYKKLKSAINEAVHLLQTNPKEFYAVVKIYRNGESSEEFSHEIKDIQFINGNKGKIIEQLKGETIETENIL